MADPYAIFANAPESKRNLIKTVLPELYDCLARVDGPESERLVWCAVAGEEHLQARVPAVGRFVRGGAPACAEHLRKAGITKPWPLSAKENYG